MIIYFINRQHTYVALVSLILSALLSCSVNNTPKVVKTRKSHLSDETLAIRGIDKAIHAESNQEINLAINRLSKAISSNISTKKKALLYYHRAILWEKKELFRRTEKDLDECFKLDPGLKNKIEQLQYEITDQRIEKQKLYLTKGEFFAEQSQWIKAIGAYSKVLEIDQRDIKALIKRAEAYRKAKFYNNAIGDYNSLIKYDRINNGKYFALMGTIYMEKGDIKRATRSFSKAINTDSKNASIYYNRGSAWLRLNEIEKAIFDFSKAIDLNSKHFYFHDRAKAYLKKGDVENAVKDLRFATRLEPSNADYLSKYESLIKKILPKVEGLKFKFIPEGKYYVGTPSSEARLYPSQEELVVTQVYLDSYYISTTEVTQETWNRYSSKKLRTGPKNYPIHSVDYQEAKDFCKKLSLQFPLYEFKLPNEFEWEVACRAGEHPDSGPVNAPENSEYFLESLDKSIQKLQLYANFKYPNGGYNRLMPVSQKQSNAWGLYDMHGNVAEWCDFYPHKSGLYNDKYGKKMIKGGSFLSTFKRCRANSRAFEAINEKKRSIGFRVVAKLNSKT